MNEQQESTFISIKEWAEDDRPREKLVEKGAGSLSDAELIAILIRTGSKNETALQLAQRILADYEQNFNTIARLHVKELMQYKGMGFTKAVTFMAALELGRRRKDKEKEKRIRIQSSENAFEHLCPLLMDLPHEEFICLLLNRANEIIKTETISRGGLTGTVVDPRIILRLAIIERASGIILAHNHPSGNLQPSEQDKSITKKINEGSRLMDIRLMDHLIIAGNQYYSFADHDLL